MQKCPYCGSEDVERVGADWVCRCCAKAWKAFTKADVGLLRLFGIAAGVLGLCALVIWGDGHARRYPR